ncbi:hypothetical protein [Reichenbachiella sp. MALMAid0571]|uniref:hypothetical protein n=1 Tax=Reichenbachiella sp. MALMAid0571 TaxID=3143939 RepID=UPI0032DFE2C2
MSIQSEYSRLVNKYLDNNMSGSEKYIFEDQLTSDPLLKAEFDHQNEIIGGLKEYRKNQLKTQLNNVSITPGLLGIISQSASMKTLSIVAASILTGSGAYYYFSSETTVKVNSLSHVESKLDFISSPMDLKGSKEKLDYRYTKNTNAASWSIPEMKNEEAAEKSEVEPNIIDFHVPEISENISGDTDPQPDQILEKAVSRNAPFADVAKIEKIDIENITNNRYKFHYKLDHNKLYLYGKFEASPYEIIEINSSQSKKLFFYYNGNYFRLNQDVKEISPLLSIQDSEVIRELNIIKSKS